MPPNSHEQKMEREKERELWRKQDDEETLTTKQTRLNQRRNTQRTLRSDMGGYHTRSAHSNVVRNKNSQCPRANRERIGHANIETVTTTIEWKMNRGGEKKEGSSRWMERTGEDYDTSR